MFRLAPYLAFVPAFLVFAVIPLGGDFTDGNDGVVSMFGHDTLLQLADPPIGILFVLALSSIAVYGIMLAGWSSRLEVPAARLGAGVGADGQLRGRARPVAWPPCCSSSRHAVDATASSSRQDSSARTGTSSPPAFVPFVVFVIAATAELNRPPFDLVEAEQELVGGFNTEYSRDPLRPVLPGRVHEHGHDARRHRHAVPRRPAAAVVGIDIPLIPDAIEGTVWFFLKLFVFLYMYVWFRATLPRFRYDQLMDLGWKVLIPVAFGWFLFLAALRVGRDRGWTRSGQLIAGVGVGRRRRRRLRCSLLAALRVSGTQPRSSEGTLF